MRFTPVALVAALALATSSNVTQAQTGVRTIDPRSAALVQQGIAAQAQGNVQAAIGLFESALVIDPGNDQAYRRLADASVTQGLAGKAIGYYGRVLALYPNDRQALVGQGKAMVQRGAMEKARENLAKLRTICGGACPEIAQLNSAIVAGPPATQVAADLIRPRPVVSEAASPVTGAPKPPETPQTEKPQPKN